MEQLKGHQYLLLGTLRKNGNFVDTPVWFAEDGNDIYIFSAGNVGKVKRLRNFKDARVAPCTALGKQLGDFIDAEAILLTTEVEKKIAHRALVKKYGFLMRSGDFFAGLTGRKKTREYIRVNLK